MQYRGVCWLGLEEETCKRHGRLLDLCRAAGKEEAREPRHHREEVRRGQDAQRAARDLTQASAGSCMRYAMEQHSSTRMGANVGDEAPGQSEMWGACQHARDILPEARAIDRNICIHGERSCNGILD